MSSSYATRDAVLAPLEQLMRMAIAHAAMFETDGPKLERLVLPCQPATPRPEPLLNFRESERMRLIEAARDGYAKATSPLIRMFSSIPPVLPGRPFELEVTFKSWQAVGPQDDLVPVDIGQLRARIGGADFSADTIKKLARDLVYFIEEHRGIVLPSHLDPWYFDAPEELRDDVAAYQGLLADSEPNAISRLQSVCKPVRVFLGSGGTLRAGGPLSEIAASLGFGKPARRHQGFALRI